MLLCRLLLNSRRGPQPHRCENLRICTKTICKAASEAKSYKVQRLSHYQSYHTCSKIATNVLRRKIEKKIEDLFGKDNFGFRRGTKDATGILRVISEGF